MIAARAVHFAATILAAGVVFFVVLVAAPAWRGDKAMPAVLRARFKAIAWISLIVSALSGAAWFAFTAETMSGQPLEQALSPAVLDTVLLRTQFGNDWLIRLALAGLLALAVAPLLSPQHRGSRAVATLSVVLAAALAGSLAWAGHAVGSNGIEAVIHPTADVLHLIAAAAWLGALPPLIVLLAAAQREAISLPKARAAVARFSVIGILSVGTIAVTGIVNTWYLVGSLPALTGTEYGELLLAKIAAFAAMVAVAAVNRLYLTPRLNADAAPAAAIRPLRRNAAVETLLGLAVLGLVAVLGTEPPAIHAAHHHAAYGAVPPDSSFIHIHTEEGMADVTVAPGHAGIASMTIRLWDGDFETLDAKTVTLVLTSPDGRTKSAPRIATPSADAVWQIDSIDLTQAGNWDVSLNITLPVNKRLVLEAPIVIAPAP